MNQLMLKKIILSVVVILPIVFALYSVNAISFSNGNPPGCTGSPSDKINCATNCHNGSIVKTETGWITSNIPETGYIPDSAYTISCTSKGVETSAKFGFEVSPQFPTGKLAGKMILLNDKETKLVGSGKYISQILAGVAGTGSKTWTFKWVAPAKGSGKLTFYGAFLVSGKPQTVVTSSLEIKENK